MNKKEYMILTNKDYYKPKQHYHADNYVSEFEADGQATDLLQNDGELEYVEVWQKVNVYCRRKKNEVEIIYV